MKCLNICLKSLTLSILMFFFITTAQNVSAAKLILIDPGHGGFDGGARSSDGTDEKELNLIIALKLKSALNREGYDVLMTRDGDFALYEPSTPKGHKKISDLNNRNKIKHSSGCDMFISIHMNWFPETKYYGAQVWYSENNSSSVFAGILQGNLKADLDPSNNRKEKLATQYKILKPSQELPAVIVECGFLSNGAECKLLRDDSYQDKIAASITKSIKSYYNISSN